MNMMTNRALLAVVAAILIVGTIFAVTATWAWIFKFLLPATTDKATRINTMVAASAYATALVGAVVALVAYWQTSGSPSLEPEITFPGSCPNEPIFQAYRPVQIPEWTDIDQKATIRMLRAEGSGLLGAVAIKNSAKYAARNPGLRITFDGLYLKIPSPGWNIIESWGDERGVKAVQWDGGTERIIHAKWARSLPDLDFKSVFVYRFDPPPKLILTVVSDGSDPQSRNVPIGIRLIDLGSRAAHVMGMPGLSASSRVGALGSRRGGSIRLRERSQSSRASPGVAAVAPAPVGESFRMHRISRGKPFNGGRREEPERYRVTTGTQGR